MPIPSNRLQNIYKPDMYTADSDRSSSGTSIERKERKKMSPMKLCTICDKVYEIVNIHQGASKYKKSELHIYNCIPKRGKEKGECPRCLEKDGKYRVITDKSFAWEAVKAEEGKKKCNICKDVKLLEEFYIEDKARNTLRYCCISCDRRKNKEYRIKQKQLTGKE